ncbi:polyisoprenoid-binding protein YceI [Sulfuritortus calidifontis]|uniref:Polyisoprenoid-binding protein YceI n=1 Tax=Sulfuritortus calidifontis TaxID=1914471 RepID=A0A4R3K169_9PROT|nr:YceI family protein [Sulfuritortus calidifontis]TCS74076.1 polyisoprenoid-binding protein YceI [Sulfuritortus calidifontis]
MKRFALILLMPLSLAVQAAPFDQVRLDQSRLGFVSKQMAVPVEGQFRRFNAQLSFDPARPQAAQAGIEIDLASIDAGSREANEEVVGRNWFNVRQYPTARFVSSGVRPLGGDRYEVRGTLTIKGKSREVTAPFSFRPAGGQGVFEGGFALKRLDFGIGEGPWGDTGIVADEVQIKFRIVAASTRPARKP